MIYQHPLAYLLGLEGIALLRAWAGDFDEEFVQRRLAEVRRLVADPALIAHPGVLVQRGDTLTGYRQWAPTYDEPRNSLFDVDEPIMYEILDALPAGIALDAACGTGRFAARLAAQGHQVIGVDSSPDMLARARSQVPAGTFVVGDVARLPVADGTVDLVVSGLALSHVADLGAAMAEFARVLRPGGHLVISDVHVELILRGSVVQALGNAGQPGLVPTYRHPTGDFLRAALSHGLQVRRCEEPGVAPSADPGAPSPNLVLRPWQEWPWALMDLVPEANRAASSTPAAIIWHFQLGQQ